MEDSFHLRPAWDRYRLRGQAQEILGEGWAPDALPFPLLTPGETATPENSESQKPQRGTLGRIRGWLSRSNRVELLIAAASILGFVIAFVVFISQRGVQTVGIMSLVALVPLALVSWLLIRADRYAPPRPRYLVLSGLWGAGAATILGSLINAGLYQDLLFMTGDAMVAQVRAAIFVAPLSEEVFKGAGVALVLLLASREIVSKANGLVIGGIVGAAFAFIENIQYFLEAGAQGSAVLGVTIFARGVLSPFVHPMATSLFGFAFASALLRRGNWWSWIWRLASGFGLAVATHALWNALASAGATWVLLYILIEIPLFVVWLIWVTRQASANLLLIRRGLAPYVISGWIAPEEEAMVCDGFPRRYARKWARKVGPSAKKSLRAYLLAAGRLGLDQVNMERTGPDSVRIMAARATLLSMIQSRDALLAAGAQHAAQPVRVPVAPNLSRYR